MRTSLTKGVLRHRDFWYFSGKLALEASDPSPRNAGFFVSASKELSNSQSANRP